MASHLDRLFNALLRLFFNQLYNSFAWSYDWVSTMVSMNHWQDWIHSVLPDLTGERVLELGHGPGHLQVAMHQSGFQVFGLDLSRAMGKQAQSRLKHLEIPVRLVRGNAQSLPFSSDCFDQIVSTFPAEYLFQSLTLAEVYRVLAPGGQLIVLPVAWIRRHSLVGRSLAWLFRVTHQAPPREDKQWQTQLIEPFCRGGFEVHTEIKSLPSSEVFVLLAGKPKML